MDGIAHYATAALNVLDLLVKVPIFITSFLLVFGWQVGIFKC